MVCPVWFTNVNARVGPPVYGITGGCVPVDDVSVDGITGGCVPVDDVPVDGIAVGCVAAYFEVIYAL
jgi:hypothetical protein